MSRLVLQIRNMVDSMDRKLDNLTEMVVAISERQAADLDRRPATGDFTTGALDCQSSALPPTMGGCK